MNNTNNINPFNVNNIGRCKYCGKRITPLESVLLDGVCSDCNDKKECEKNEK